MDFIRSIMVAAGGLKAQNSRMRTIAENIANARSTAQTPGGDPYRRKVSTFQSYFDRQMGAEMVKPGRIVRDDSDFKTEFNPGHPAADANGYVKMPNVNTLVETMDMREAQRSYEANLNVIGATRRMVLRTLDILRA